MGDQENKKSIWAPLSPRNLALAAASEIGIASASDALGIPQGAGLIFSVGAGATLEVIGNYFAEAKRILRNAQVAGPENPLPETVRQELSEVNVAKALTLIEEEEARMTRLIYERAINNPFGLKPGVSLIQVV